MEEIGVRDAKARLSYPIEQVSNGRRFTITRRGVPVPRLVPVSERNREGIARAVRELRSLSDAHSLGGLSVRQLIDQDRR